MSDTNATSPKTNQFQVFIRWKPMTESGSKAALDKLNSRSKSPIRQRSKSPIRSHQYAQQYEGEKLISSSKYNNLQIKVENDNTLALCLEDSSLSTRLQFTNVFPSNITNQGVYDRACKFSIPQTFDYNFTWLAYGITGSGKTHTMFGNGAERGLISYYLNDLFTMISSKAYTVKIVANFIEIYNENIFDLFSQATPQNKMLICEDQNQGVIIKNTTNIIIDTKERLLLALEEGLKKRSTSNTLNNLCSSRSHALLTLQIIKTGETGNYTTSIVRFVDLAGSEKVDLNNTKTSNKIIFEKFIYYQNLALIEGSNINRSLLALATCINILSDKNKRGSFIPYRDSKLTRLLKDSLSGNTKSVMISCIHQDKSYSSDNWNTIKYSARVMSIHTQFQKNKEKQSDGLLQCQETISSLLQEIATLKNMLKLDVNDGCLMNSTITKVCQNTNMIFQLDGSQIMEAENNNLIDAYDHKIRDYEEKKLILKAEVEELENTMKQHISDQENPTDESTHEILYNKLAADLFDKLDEVFSCRTDQIDIDRLIKKNLTKLNRYEKIITDEKLDREKISKIEKKHDHLAQMNAQNFEYKQKLKTTSQELNVDIAKLKSKLSALGMKKSNDQIKLEIGLGKQKLETLELQIQNLYLQKEKTLIKQSELNKDLELAQLRSQIIKFQNLASERVSCNEDKSTDNSFFEWKNTAMPHFNEKQCEDPEIPHFLHLTPINKNVNKQKNVHSETCKNKSSNLFASPIPSKQDYSTIYTPIKKLKNSFVKVSSIDANSPKPLKNINSSLNQPKKLKEKDKSYARKTSNISNNTQLMPPVGTIEKEVIIKKPITKVVALKSIEDGLIKQKFKLELFIKQKSINKNLGKNENHNSSKKLEYRTNSFRNPFFCGSDELTNEN